MNQNRNINENAQQQQRAQAELQQFNSFSDQLKRTWPIALIGTIGFATGILLVIWNEGRAVATTQTLDDAVLNVKEVSQDFPIDPAHYGKLIYLSGVLNIQEPMTEVDYGVSILAVKLKRRVQMYQWNEEVSTSYSNSGPSVNTYIYSMEWRDNLIDSQPFEIPEGHWNPKEFPIKSRTQLNEHVTVGKYELGRKLKWKFKDFVEVTSDERPERKDIKLHDGLYYHTQDVHHSEIGDIRIQFSYAGQHGQIVTIVAMLDETNKLVPFRSKFGQDILILHKGYLSIEDMFKLEHIQSKLLTWLVRGGAWFLMYLGCVCLGNILRSLIIRSPFLRDILPTGTSSLKMTVSMSTSLLVTALAWMWYRPLLGSFLILVCVCIIAFLKYMSGNSHRNYHRL